MARNQNSSQQTPEPQATAGAAPRPQPPPNTPHRVPGGAPGVLPTTVQQPPAPVIVKKQEGPAAKTYRAVNGGFVSFNGIRTVIRAGKIVSDKDYSIDNLLAQGIQLREIEAVPVVQRAGATILPPATVSVVGQPDQPQASVQYDKHLSQCSKDELNALADKPERLARLSKEEQAIYTEHLATKPQASEDA